MEILEEEDNAEVPFEEEDDCDDSLVDELRELLQFVPDIFWNFYQYCLKSEIGGHKL